MTKLEQRLKELDDLLAPLNMERDAVWQQILAERSQFKVGDTITWKSYGSRYGSNKLTYVGRVIGIKEWVCGEPMWRVKRIRKDGTEGGGADVRSYHNPIKFT